MGTPDCLDSSSAATARIGLYSFTSARIQPPRASRLLRPRFFSGCAGYFSTTTKRVHYGPRVILIFPLLFSPSRKLKLGTNAVRRSCEMSYLSLVWSPDRPALKMND